MNVSCPMPAAIPSSPDLPQKVCEGFNDKITTAVSSYLPQVPEHIQVTDVRLENDSVHIELYFIGENMEHHYVKDFMERLVRQTNDTICDCHFIPASLQLQSEPALHAVRLYTHEGDHVIEGHLLTLACKAKGPPSLKFMWRKDGAAVRTDRTDRNMWETTIASDDGVTQLSILDIDRAQPFDEGTFSCEVYGKNESRTTSLKVSLIKRPWPSMKPLAASVLYGTHMICACLARNHDPQLSYTWFRDGLEFTDPGINQEVIEDLQPSGSRLHVRSAQVSTVYTCEIKGQAGRVLEGCHVTITHGLTESNSCQEEVNQAIKWSQTVGGAMDIQACPNDKEIEYTENGISKAYRKCQCSRGRCSWQEPNFAECAGDTLRNLDKNMRKLSSGYENITPRQVFQWLKLILLQQDTARPLLGDLQLAAKILNDVHKFDVMYMHNRTISVKNITWLVSLILERSLTGTIDELKATAVWSYLLKLSETMYMDKDRFINTFTHVKIKERKLDIQVTPVDLEEMLEPEVIYGSPDIMVKVPATVGKLQRRKRKEAHNYTDGLHFVTIRYNDLQLLMKSSDYQKGNVNMDPDVLTVGHIRSSILDDETFKIIIEISHTGKEGKMGANTTTCLNWHYSVNFPNGKWKTDKCSVLRSTVHKTECSCYTPVQFAIAYVQDKNQIGAFNGRGTCSSTMVVCCSLSLLGFLSTIILNFFFWRKLRDFFRIITINFSVSMVMMNIVLIIFFTLEHTKAMCYAVFLLLTFTFLVTFTFTGAEMFYIVFSLLWNKVVPSNDKIIILSWGAPLVLVLITTVVREIIRTDSARSMCWMDVSIWELIVFVVPIGMIFLMYISFFTISARELYFRTRVAAKLDRRKIVVYMSRSLLLLVFEVAILLLCVVVSNKLNNRTYLTVLAACIAIMGLTYFFLYGVLNIKILSREKSNMDRVSQSSLIGRGKKSAKGSQSGESTQSAIKYKQKDEPSQHDKASEVEDKPPRYTREQKEYLLALLGTSKLRNENSQTKQTDMTENGESQFNNNDPTLTSTSRLHRGPSRTRSSGSAIASTCLYKPERGRAYISDNHVHRKANVAKHS